MQFSRLICGVEFIKDLFMIGLVTLFLTTSLLSRNIFVDTEYKGFSFIV